MYKRQKIYREVGKEHLVLDLSCRKRDDKYYIVTDRWQKYTDEAVDEKILNLLMSYCDEFLIHAVDVEGKAQGIETQIVSQLGEWGQMPITYAGGVHSCLLYTAAFHYDSKLCESTYHSLQYPWQNRREYAA